jgi:pimeloyl-ACP methyl ester carboxylesterase
LFKAINSVIQTTVYMKRLLLVLFVLFMLGFMSQGTSKGDAAFNASNVKDLEEQYQFPLKSPPSGKTLLLIHGYGLTAKIHFEDMYSDSAIQAYYNSVIPIDYYGAAPSSNMTYSLGRADFDLNTPLEEIALELRNFMLDPNNSGLFTDKIDVVGFSMGGLIVRYFIKTYYEEIRAVNYTFDDVVLIATPNKGIYHLNGLSNIFMIFYATLSTLFLIVSLFSGPEKKMRRLRRIFLWFLALTLIVILIEGPVISVSARETQAGSSFLQKLNTGDVTLHSVDDAPPFNDINWSTFRGDGDGKFFFERMLIAFSFVNEPCDGEITVDSVILGDGAMNYGPYDRNHDEMVMFNTSIEQDRIYFSDIYYVLTEELYPI